jgi:hypothetical protein
MNTRRLTIVKQGLYMEFHTCLLPGWVRTYREWLGCNSWLQAFPLALTFNFPKVLVDCTFIFIKFQELFDFLPYSINDDLIMEQYLFSVQLFDCFLCRWFQLLLVCSQTVCWRLF